MSSVQPEIGGGFLIREGESRHTFIPEDFTEEQRLIAETCTDFLVKEVYPQLNELDKHIDEQLMPALLDKAGALGLLGTSVPEEFSGSGMDFNSSMLVAEAIGAGHSFAVALSAHTGIGTLPVLYYGSEAQKRKYLPGLASGRLKASYCLTEPESGSDANSGKTRAVLSEDGTCYRISGQKLWITNAGFADLFIVFARIEADKYLSAFLVEKGFGGISLGPEEDKMGIRGSSTRQVFFNECRVPLENMLGNRQDGFKIAVNILNVGRIKLAAAAIGAAKRVAFLSRSYAGERKQFGRAIIEFGAIKFKLAAQHYRIYAAESAVYRAGQAIEDLEKEMIASGLSAAEAKLKSVENFSVECALLKVHASEVLDFVVDEGVQVYGGMGFSADGPMDRAYRDSRINRIFEGTNEINRLLAAGNLLKKALKGEINLLDPARKVQKEIMAIPDFSSSGTESLLEREKGQILGMKKSFLLVAGAATMKVGNRLEEEQEILMDLADMMMHIYISESALLRSLKLLAERGEAACRKEIISSQLVTDEAISHCSLCGRRALLSFAKGDELKMLLLGLKRFLKPSEINTIALRRELTDLIA